MRIFFASADSATRRRCKNARFAASMIMHLQFSLVYICSLSKTVRCFNSLLIIINNYNYLQLYLLQKNNHCSSLTMAPKKKELLVYFHLKPAKNKQDQACVAGLKMSRSAAVYLFEKEHRNLQLHPEFIKKAAEKKIIRRYKNVEYVLKGSEYDRYVDSNGRFHFKGELLTRTRFVEKQVSGK